jgi:hypothetical protein
MHPSFDSTRGFASRMPFLQVSYLAYCRDNITQDQKRLVVSNNVPVVTGRILCICRFFGTRFWKIFVFGWFFDLHHFGTTLYRLMDESPLSYAHRLFSLSVGFHFAVLFSLKSHGRGLTLLADWLEYWFDRWRDIFWYLWHVQQCFIIVSWRPGRS